MMTDRRFSILLHRLGSARGFGFVEIMTAMMLLSIGLLAMAAAQVSMIRTEVRSRSIADAALLAEAKIEEIRAFGRASLVPSPVGRDKQGMVECAWEVGRAASVNGLAAVQVVCGRYDHLGRFRSVELRTLMKW